MLSTPTSVPATSPATSACAFFSASPPWLYRLRSVVAAAIPDGNGNCSWLIICRFIGIASQTPMAPVANVDAVTIHHGW